MLDESIEVNQVSERAVAAIESGKYPFVMCNFAPPDMVGHTGASQRLFGFVVQCCCRRLREDAGSHRSHGQGDRQCPERLLEARLRLRDHR